MSDDEWTPPTDGAWSPDGSGKAVEVEDTPYSPGDKIIWEPGRSNEETAKIIARDSAGTGLSPTWSASRLDNYETCPRKLHPDFKHTEREEHPAAARGTAIHDIAECYVKSEEGGIEEKSKPFVSEWEAKILPKFQDRFDHLREQYADAKVECEGEWGFNIDWETTGWMVDDTWARMKLDALEWQSETSAKVIDYKTGRKFGNEMKHATQGMIYAIGTFMRFPELEFVEVSFWYLDHDQESLQRYNRDQAMQFLPRITDRATVLTSDTELRPNPSPYNCKWCDFNKNEACEWRQNG